MSENRPFGFGADDFDRTARMVGEGIRDAIRGLGGLIDEFGVETVHVSSAGPGVTSVSYPRRRTTGDAGEGVWAIVLVGEDGCATVEQVHASELDALRANSSNTDGHRRVRFLPYGIAVSALDADRDPAATADGEPSDPEH